MKCEVCGYPMRRDWLGNPAIPSGTYEFFTCPACEDSDDKQTADREGKVYRQGRYQRDPDDYYAEKEEAG